MPQRLEFRKRDPNDLGRGEGYYYLRGGKTPGSKNHTYTMPNGKVKVIKGPYYSKYSKKRDANTKSTGYKKHKTGIPTFMAKKYAHVSDGDLKKNIQR